MQALRERCLLFAPSGQRAGGAPLFGLHLVERTVLALLRAGLREFLLLGDPEACAETARQLRSGRCRGARLRLLDPEESLLAALAGDEACYLVRSDAFYDRRLLRRFVRETRDAAGTVAAVDFRSDALSAQEGAPRVAGWRVSEGPGERLRLAGQGLMAPEGVFTGLARVTPAFARALEEVPADARRLEGALTLLAQREPVATWAVGELWQCVRDQPASRAADLVRARRKVLAGAVGVGEGVVARHLNRPVSRRITERLIGRDVKPWQMSVASFLATLGAGGAFAVGHATTGGMMAQFAAILDGVDGELARIRYQDSAFGGVYDALLDRIGDAALIGGMTLYAWLAGAGNSAVALGFGAVAGSSLSMLVKEKYGTQFRRPWRSEHEGRWRWLLLGRDGRLFLTLVAGVTGYVEAVLAYLAVGTHLHAGARIYRIRGDVGLEV